MTRAAAASAGAGDRQVPDTRKFRAHTGWAPLHSFEQTTDDLLDDWRARIRTGTPFLSR